MVTISGAVIVLHAGSDSHYWWCMGMIVLHMIVCRAGLYSTPAVCVTPLPSRPCEEMRPGKRGVQAAPLAEKIPGGPPAMPLLRGHAQWFLILSA